MFLSSFVLLLVLSLLEGTRGAEECGMRSGPGRGMRSGPGRQERAINAHVVRGPCSWPWLAYAVVDYGFGPLSVGTVTLVGDDTILASGQILEQLNYAKTFYPAMTVTITVGEYDTRISEPFEENIKVDLDSSIPYPGFGAGSPFAAGNVALLKLEKNVTRSACVMPVCLPDDTVVGARVDGSGKCWLAGWGQVYPTITGHFKVPLEVEVLWQENHLCTKFNELSGLPANYSCATDRPEHTSYTCENDVGTVIVCSPNGSNKWYVEGIVAGHNCQQVDHPFPVIDVLPYTQWLGDNS